MKLSEYLYNSIVTGKIGVYSPYSNVTEEEYTRRTLAHLYLTMKQKGTIRYNQQRRENYKVINVRGLQVFEFSVYNKRELDNEIKN